MITGKSPIYTQYATIFILAHFHPIFNVNSKYLIITIRKKPSYSYVLTEHNRKNTLRITNEGMPYCLTV